MIKSVRFCLSYDPLNVVYRLKSLCSSLKIHIVVSEVVMTLRVSFKSVM